LKYPTSDSDIVITENPNNADPNININNVQIGTNFLHIFLQRLGTFTIAGTFSINTSCNSLYIGFGANVVVVCLGKNELCDAILV
jgi:hypothetical protein